MEVRCGGCEKLFRVSDDKIAGTGIKFPCTRCGAYVKITREDLEHYTMSQSAVSVLDLFEPKPQPPAPSATPEAEAPVVEETVPPAQDAPATSEVTPEKEPQPTVEFEPEVPAPAEEVKPADALTPDTVMPSDQKAEAPFEVPQETKPETQPAPQTSPAVPKKETAPPSAPPAARTVDRAVFVPVIPAEPSGSGRMLLIVFGVLLIVGLIAYGIFSYYQPSSPAKIDQTPKLFSIEGLYLINSGGALQDNGDLLITGEIKSTAKEQRAGWYVMTVVYDANGEILARIRLLNGKQIFSRRDYEILAKRGVNIKDLKMKSLQQTTGVVIPPEGTVKFKMRYLEPPDNVASFNSQILPFDLVKLLKEIAKENK
jgi:hypothetical protein